jgi:hypothetical protein
MTDVSSEDAAPSAPRARVRRVWLVAAAAGVVAAAGTAFVLLRGGGTRRPATSPAPPPLLGFDARRGADYERRTASGAAHVVFALSPGGVVATAARVAALRPLAQRAVAGSGFSADRVEAMVFLESAGRPDVVAGTDVAAAAGVGQILAGTATDLLGMHVDLAESRALTSAIVAATARGDAAAVARLQAQRRTVDDRFDPARALAGMVRYLGIARARFGRTDLAVESYHMGIGNLQGALRAYAGVTTGDVAALVRRDDLSYARLYFGSSPLAHAAAFARIRRLGDDSSNYLWKVLASEQIMRAYRADRAGLERTAALQVAGPSAAAVVQPPDAVRYGDRKAVERALKRRELVALAPPPGAGFAADPQLATLATHAGVPAADVAALRPRARATLVELAATVRLIAGATAPLRISRTVVDTASAERLGLTGAATPYATGAAFDVLRRYASPAQAAAFQFCLDRLQALGRIAWYRDATTIHVTVAS